MHFQQISATTLPSQYPALQNTLRQLARKRNIQIRMATGIAGLLAIAAIIEYSMIASTTPVQPGPQAIHESVKKPLAGAPVEATAADMPPDKTVRKNRPAR